ncbi:hypothetical protein WH47_05198 [Habropoda laboriosa]|uniref:Uncharacterized protein n=1 Tax=Habropoda laboriosa TaxID=597456 RepID=A0A0L7QUG6_9HYME|nr:hypothetical protein WH47_05198 [Habropoda laboriosa]
MEIIQLAEKKKAFAHSDVRYQNPFKEAIKLRKLWNYDKPRNKRQEQREAKRLYREANHLMKEEKELDKISVLINKGLFLDPMFHPIYALKGDVYLRQGKWTKAVQNYENAESMAIFDTKLSGKDTKAVYNKQLIEAYRKRADWYCEQDLLIEALGDYERVFLLKLPGMRLQKLEVGALNDDYLTRKLWDNYDYQQDKLLEILRKLYKYKTFRSYWDEFITDPDPMRTSVLLTVHAEYKIYLREMSVARHMLLKALHYDKNNEKAQELLQVVFSTGHSLSAYSVIWCMHNCYDKALVTVEKALDCNPYNPGFTLLKTIVLRLSGRHEEATSWLQSLSDNFYKLHEPTKDKEKSIMGKLSISETRNQLIKQWYLVRYDMAMKCMIQDKLEAAVRIVYRSNLVKYCVESYILLGDYFLKHKDVDLALKSYLKCRERMRESGTPISRKTIDLAQRIIDILNDRAEIAADEGYSKRAIEIANQALQIFNEDQIPLHELRLQRGRALLNKARGLFQAEKKQKTKNKQCCETTADSLRFIRELNMDLHQTLYGDTDIERIIDRFAPKRKLPRSLKILMQFS